MTAIAELEAAERIEAERDRLEATISHLSELREELGRGEASRHLSIAITDLEAVVDRLWRAANP